MRFYKKALALVTSLAIIFSFIPEKIQASDSENAGKITVKEVSAKAAVDSSKPSNLNVKYEDGKLKVTWNKASGAVNYKVYRARSRFAEYKEIGSTTDTNYTDKNINSSKYSNYYKIEAIDSSGISNTSEPASLEISMFGLNTYIFAPSDDADKINSTTASVFDSQDGNQFGSNRFVLAYKPGDYTQTNTVQMAYYTYLMGLGKTPYDVRIQNVETPAQLPKDNVTCNFWVGIGNVTIADTDNTKGKTDIPKEEMFRWGASQAAPARRLNVERTAFFQWEYQFYGDDINKTNPINTPYASGGFIADSNFDQDAGSWSQQQYYYRNCNLTNGVYGVNWNQVVQGCSGVTNANTVDNPISSQSNPENKVDLISKVGRSNWERRGCTTVIDNTPEMREKPFLYFDSEADKYKVFIPAMRENSQGISWSETSMGEGTSISVDNNFYIANPDTDTAKTINRQLKSGRNIIFRPGIYHVSEPIKVTNPNTVLMGMGMATIIPDNTESAIIVDDVGGVSISDLILDAGNYSETLLTVGKEGCNKDHSYNPTVLHDVFYRVGGTGSVARCGSCQVINSNDVIIDHTWVWRADHGDNVGWEQNTAKNGLIVNGDNITIYGLFVEHFQQYDIIWRGENGTTYFLQNEKCYDPQDQAGWMSHEGTKKGYASYKVTNNVKKHYAVGMGIYDVFIYTNGASIYLEDGIEAPNTPDVLFENVCTVEIASREGPQVGINHIINGTAAGIRTGAGLDTSTSGYTIQRLLSYQNGLSRSLPDCYTSEGDFTVVEQNGLQPTNDPDAEKDITKDPFTSDNEKPLWDMTDDDYANRIKDVVDDPIDNPQNTTNNPTTNNPKTTTQAVVVKVGQKFTVGKYTYKVTKVKGKSGNVTLYTVKSKYRKKLKKATVAAKVKYKGYSFKVTQVGSKSFKKCKKLKSVTIGKYVTKINKKAFYQSSKLSKITVKGKKLKKISANAFHKKVKKKIKIKATKTVKKRMLKALKRKK